MDDVTKTGTDTYLPGTLPEDRFSAAARWIWADKGDRQAWRMFRRTFPIPKGRIRTARLLITSCQFHIAYLNGRLSTRGPSRSYDFQKAYHVIDVSAAMLPGSQNVIAVLCHKMRGRDAPNRLPAGEGLLAELVVQMEDGAIIAVSTDRDWKALRHPSFRPDTAWFAIPHGPEEWFDAREEPEGWTSADFDDARWPAATVVGPVGTAPWSAMQKCITGQLCNDIAYPARFTAIELAQPCAGPRFRIGPYTEGLRIYCTEISCGRPAAARLHFKDGGSTVSLNGVPVPPDGKLALGRGASFLCVSRLAYGDGDLELLLETEDELSFSAHGILRGGDARWAVMSVPSTTMKFPWHETAGDVLAGVEEVPRLMTARGPAEIPDDLRRRFAAAEEHEPSVLYKVITQRYKRVAGGFTDPGIDAGQPRGAADPADRPPLLRPQSLLHDNDECTLVMPPCNGRDAHFIVDFGREVIGYLGLSLEAPVGAIVDVQGFELIDGRGIEWMDVHNGFRYVCREGLQDFLSHYRRGFRYVSVTLRNFNRPIGLRCVYCRQAAYPVQEAGGFECSDPLLNQVYRMSVDTARVCTLETYVDCPGHEQSFWVGDARITALINLITFGAYDVNQYFIRIIGQSLRPEWVQEYWPKDRRYLEGRYLPIAAFPNYPEGCLPMWTFLWLMQCWEHYLYGGSLEDLAENFSYMMGTLEHCRLMTNERGLLDMPGSWNLIEWGNTDLSPYGEVTANNVLLAKCTRLTAAMARELGQSERARELDAEAQARTDAVNRLCWDPARGAYMDTVRDEWAYGRYVDWARSEGRKPVTREAYRGLSRVSEQTNTLALICDCVPEERLASVAAIARRVENGRYVAGSPALRTSGVPSDGEAPDGIVAVGSPFFLFFSLEALFRLGLGQAALDVMRRDWGVMAELGTRTCWETFKYDDMHWTRSVAHAWSAAPAVYLPQRVLGVRPVEPGYRTFVVDPQPCDLSWARGSVATPYGPLHVSWRRKSDGGLDLKVSAPAECRRVT